MPYPNEHAARIRDPGDFDPKSFRSKDLKGGVRIIVAKLKGEDSMTVQAYRFSVDQFTVEQAKQWLKDYKITYILFEPAVSDIVEHSGIMGMHWGIRRNQTSGEGDVSTRIKGVSKQKISSVKKNLKTVVIIGGILGGTVGTIAVAKLAKSNRKNAMTEAIKLTKKWQVERNAKNVIYLPAHLPRSQKVVHLKDQDWYQTYKKHSAEMEALANTLKGRSGGIHDDVPRRTLVEMERIAEILRNGGLP